jgi:hypothetical protein
MIGDMGVETFLEVTTDIGVDLFFQTRKRRPC